KKGDDNSPTTEFGRIVRLDIDPDQYPKPVVLDLHYQLVPGRNADKGGPLGTRRLLTTFPAPVLRGKEFIWETRWQLRLPAGWIPLWTGEGTGAEQSWGWRGWLLGPRSAVSSDGLENWFHTGVETPGSDASEPGLLCRQTTLEPLQLV